MSNVSRVYASALFELACDANKDKIILDQLKTLDEAFDPTVYDAMASIDLTIAQKKQTMDAVLQDQMDQLVVHFIDVLLDNHRFGSFHSIVFDYLDRYRHFHGITIARVVSPRPLDKDSLEKIKQILSKKSGQNVELQCELDPDLIAGFTIEMDGTFLDYSLRNRLNAMKVQLKKGEQV